VTWGRAVPVLVPIAALLMMIAILQVSVGEAAIGRFKFYAPRRPATDIIDPMVFSRLPCGAIANCHSSSIITATDKCVYTIYESSLVHVTILRYLVSRTNKNVRKPQRCIKLLHVICFTTRDAYTESANIFFSRQDQPSDCLTHCSFFTKCFVLRKNIVISNITPHVRPRMDIVRWSSSNICNRDLNCAVCARFSDGEVTSNRDLVYDPGSLISHESLPTEPIGLSRGFGGVSSGIGGSAGGLISSDQESNLHDRDEGKHSSEADKPHSEVRNRITPSLFPEPIRLMFAIGVCFGALACWILWRLNRQDPDACPDHKERDKYRS
jgi:hypothetical protein